MCLGLNPTESVDGILTLPETDITLENKPSQKGNSSSNHPFSGALGKDSWPPGPLCQRHHCQHDCSGSFCYGLMRLWVTLTKFPRKKFPGPQGNPYKESSLLVSHLACYCKYMANYRDRNVFKGSGLICNFSFFFIFFWDFV